MAMAEPKLRRVRETMRQLGWLNGCLLALDRLLAGISGRRARLYKYYFVAQPVAQKRWLPAQRGANLEIRRVTASDPVVAQFPRPAAAAAYRFGQDAVCLAEFKAGVCIGFIWFTLGPYQEDEVRCRYVPLPAGEAAWDFDVYLQPEQRNGIAFLKLWDEANLFLAARKIRWTLSRIEAFNSGSVLSHARMGAARIGAATFLRLGPCQISLASVRPHFHLSIRPDSFPTFALDPGRAAAKDAPR